MNVLSLHSRRTRGFTMVELLVVVAIMAILLGLAALSIRGIKGSGNINNAISDISGMLEQGRSYATAQNTYVWIVLYENAPANGPKEVFVGAFGSSDGSDPFNWPAAPPTVLIPPGTVGSTTLTQIIRTHHYKGVHLQSTTLPSAPSNPNLPATNPAVAPATAAPVLQFTAQSDAGPVTLSSAGAGTISVYWMIQFTPTGAARTGPNPIDSVWLGLQPSLSQTVLDTKNVASIKVSGLTGSVTVYRP